MLKKLLGDSAVYGLSSILGRTLNYLLVPLYTSVFLPSEYGIITELYAYVAFLNIIFTYGMETTFFRFSTKQKEKGQYYFNLSQTLILCSTMIFGGLIYWSADFFVQILDYPGKGFLLRWLALILCFDTIVALPFAKLRLEGKAIKFAAFKLINILINISLNLFFLLLCPYLLELGDPAIASWVERVYSSQLGVGYVFLSNLLANAFNLIFFYRTWLTFHPRISWAELREPLRYALPLLVLGLAGVTNEMLSRSMLRFRLPEGFYGELSNLAALGIFGAVYKLSIFMTLTVQAFKYAFEPFFFQQSDATDAKMQYSKVMNGFIIFVCLGWQVITLILPELAPIFLRSPIYLTGLSVVPLLLGGGVFLGVFYNLSVWYKLTDNNWYGAGITILGALLTIVLNWALIPIWGYMGSGWTCLITYVVMAVASYLIGRRHYPISYQWPKAGVYLGITFFSVMMVNFANFDTLIRYIFGLALLVLTLVVVIIMEKPKGFRSFVGLF